MTFGFVSGRFRFLIRFHLQVNASGGSIDRRIRNANRVLFRGDHMVSNFLFTNVNIRITSRAFRTIRCIPKTATIHTFRDRIFTRVNRAILILPFIAHSNVSNCTAMGSVYNEKDTSSTRTAKRYNNVEDLYEVRYEYRGVAKILLVITGVQGDERVGVFR